MKISNSIKKIRPINRINNNFCKSRSTHNIFSNNQYNTGISVIKEAKENSKNNINNFRNSAINFKNNANNGKIKLHPLKKSTSSFLLNENFNSQIESSKICFNKLSLRRINFQFDEYGEYPNDDFQPSIYFFKFLANKPDYEKENSEKGKICKSKLKLYVPDTIVLNDLDINYWIYTDTEGYVNRIEEVDSEVIEKFKSIEKDENELIAVSKMPIMKDNRIDENQLDLLNMEELEKCLFSKSGNQMVIQRFIKCKGPKAFICRSVWRKNKPPYLYILTNKANYHDDILNQKLKYVINSKEENSYTAFYSSSGKHLEETNIYMNNIVKFIESHSDIIFDELVGDFMKDESGIWWFINLKAMKIFNIKKFITDDISNRVQPKLNFFINQRFFDNSIKNDSNRKFDYKGKIKCKLCGIDYSKKNLKYELTTKMIMETGKMLKHVEFEKIRFNIDDRPDLKHIFYSMIYLPFRVCEDCYLLYETLNDIKDSEIETANFFRIPVDRINFCFNYYKKIKEQKDKVTLTKKELEKIQNIYNEIDNMVKASDEIDDNKNNVFVNNNDNNKNLNNNENNNINDNNIDSESNNESNDEINDNDDNDENNNAYSGSVSPNKSRNNIGSNKLLTFKSSKNLSKIIIDNKDSNFNPKNKQNIYQNNNNLNNNEIPINEKPKENKKPNLYRILVMFNDIIWSEKIEIPSEELYIVFTFLGKSYKFPIKIEPYTHKLDYTIINFWKIFHIICTEPEGFINFADKNRYMEVKLGFFEKTEKETQKKEIQELLKKNITIEDEDIYTQKENFIPYASVELSTLGLKYGTNYRNNLNGLLFKKTQPYYVGKLRCLIRINKVKEISDTSKYILHNFYNLLIPPINFVASNELPDYWIEIVERQKIRKNILKNIINCMKKHKIQFIKERDKNKLLQALETLVSFYAKKST